MVVLLYFDKTQNVNINLLISAHRLTRTAPGFTLHFALRQSKATEPICTTDSHHQKISFEYFVVFAFIPLSTYICMYTK